MAAKNQFNTVYTTYHESFLALSVSIRVVKHQLMMEAPISSQAPVLRYRDITFTTEYLKESLSAVCPVLGGNVARVRQGATLPLVEVDFTDEKALERFCKSISNGICTVIFIMHVAVNLISAGVIQSRLQNRLERNTLSRGREEEEGMRSWYDDGLHTLMATWSGCHQEEEGGAFGLQPECCKNARCMYM